MEWWKWKKGKMNWECQIMCGATPNKSLCLYHLIGLSPYLLEQFSISKGSSNFLLFSINLHDSTISKSFSQMYDPFIQRLCHILFYTFNLWFHLHIPIYIYHTGIGFHYLIICYCLITYISSSIFLEIFAIGWIDLTDQIINYGIFPSNIY